MQHGPTHNHLIQVADIEWQGDTALSARFGDVYFSRENGIAETNYVFLQQNRLQQRWQEDDFERFTIAETGFGTGLNFFCTAQLWRACAKPGNHLHFISVEKFPLSFSDMQVACDRLANFRWISNSLLEQYPAAAAGSHRLFFAEFNITLTLMYGDAMQSYRSLDGNVDAWYLDGFAPAQNPDMWQAAFYGEMARLSHSGTTFATFTAAGEVKRGLQHAGFEVEKCRGFGKKRDMLRGRYTLAEQTGSSASAQQQPWFHFHYRSQKAGRIAIIGAGLAGCSVARKMADRGWLVTLLETEAEIASQGSGNPTGITFTKLSLHDTPQNRYYQSAYLYACRYLRNLFAQHQVEEGEDWSMQGVLRLAYDEKELSTQQALIQSRIWPHELMQSLSPDEIQSRFGINVTVSGLLLKKGGWVNPKRLCETLILHPNIELITSCKVTSLQRRSDRWEVETSSLKQQPSPVLSQTFDAVVLANAFGCSQFPFAQHLMLKSVRGQISYLAASAMSRTLPIALNYEGYINPARHGFHSVGATFNPKVSDRNERVEDHEWNCNQLRNSLPELAQSLIPDALEEVRGRVGFRCQTPDYLPIVGPLPNETDFLQQYTDLGKGFLKRKFATASNLPGLFVSTAHGSRGITSTCFAAEIIASYLSGEPQVIDRSVLFALHPARFLIRKIKRRQL